MKLAAKLSALHYYKSLLHYYKSLLHFYKSLLHFYNFKKKHSFLKDKKHP